MPLRILIFALFLTAMNVFAQTPTIETGVPQTLARWRAANYSDVRYKLNLTLEKQSPTLKGTIEISLKNNADQIILDWRKIRGKEDLSRIENVFINGKSADYEEINEHLVFKDGVTKGENVIKLNFTSPITTSGSAITRYVDKEDGAEYVYSLFVPSDASTAFPVFDQPDLKARFSLGVRLPKTWKMVSNAEIDHTVTVDGITCLPIQNRTPLELLTNSKPAQKVENKTTVNNTKPSSSCEILDYWQFKETQPISTYIFAFAAGDFAMLGEGENPQFNIGTRQSIIYFRKSQAEKFKQHAAETFRLNREAVKYLESYFDYKFPFPKYDLVLIPEFPFGGMEHAGATFLREDRIIFPTEPTKNDFVTRANLIFHEAAHQWFGDTVTMRWFDDLWLKEGFAEFMAYKTLERVMPEYNSWKIFYERNKQAAYLTDSTRGTTPIYQEIPNLSAAKSAYGNIVYRKAPSFLKQAEFYLGADKFQTAVRAFLKKHQFANAEWTNLVKEFEKASGQDLRQFSNFWVKQRGTVKVKMFPSPVQKNLPSYDICKEAEIAPFEIEQPLNEANTQIIKFKTLFEYEDGKRQIDDYGGISPRFGLCSLISASKKPVLIFPNYQDYGYGIFLLDEKSRDYVLENIQNEKDDFLRTMMWGSLWDSMREAELAPQDYVELVIKNINVETDESTIQTLLSRVSTAMNYYLSDEQREKLSPKIEGVLTGGMWTAKTVGQKITFFRAYLNIASSEDAQRMLKTILKSDGKPIGLGSHAISGDGKIPAIELPPLKTKDKFDIVTKLLILESRNRRILGKTDAEELLAELEKTETSDEAKRYAYAGRAGIGTDKNKAKFFDDFTNNKELSESWIESAFVAFNATRHSELTLPYLEKALAELPNLKRTRKIFFVNGWLGAFIGGQRSEQALAIVNKFLANNPSLDKDLRLKILENADGLERAVKIRQKFSGAK